MICGYSLNELPGDMPCPECGHTESTAWAALMAGGQRVHHGVRLVQAGILGAMVALLFIFLFAIIMIRITQNTAPFGIAMLVVTAAIATALAVLVAVGLWKTTTDPGSYGANARLRLLARGALLCAIGPMFVGMVIPNKSDPLWGIFAAMMTVAAGVGLLLLERMRENLSERLGVAGRVRIGFFGKALMALAVVLILSVPVRVVQHFVGGSMLAWGTTAGWTAWLLLLGLLYQSNMFVRVLQVAGIVRDPTAVPTAGVPATDLPAAGAPPVSPSGAASGD